MPRYRLNRRRSWRGLILVGAVALSAYLGSSHRHHLDPTVLAAGSSSRSHSLMALPKPNPSAPIDWVPAGAVPNVPVSEPEGILFVYGQPNPLWSRHANQQGPIASTTKLMTAYLATQSLPMSQIVQISDVAAATGGSEMFMKPGDHFTVHQLLVGLLLRSANNAAVALGQAVSGHTSAFVSLMNATARQLGMMHTHYADPNGLSTNSQSSAADLATIAQIDLRSKILRAIFRTKQTTLPENPSVVNIDGIIWRDPTAIGLKTGWTTPAGACLVFAATRPVDGHMVTLVGVLLHGGLFTTEYNDAEGLLNWGFKAIAPKVAALAARHQLPPQLTP